MELRGDVEVIGDPTRLRQVLVHLLNNAIKFTPAGTVKVALAVEHRGREVGVALRIADTGRGMSPSELARRREVDPEATRQGGVGLQLCHRLIALMGGSLDIESRLGLGTCFTIRLALPTTGARVPEPDLRGLRVAVISENLRRASALVHTLQRMNVCAQGSEHLRELVGERWDVVLVDHAGLELDRCAAALGVAAPRALRLRGALGPDHTRSVHFPAPRATLADALRSPGDAPVREQRPADPNAPWFDQVHALIAEDNLVNRMVIQSFLTSMGVSCDVVNDGKDATEAFDPSRHHIVFMDVMMPRMSGIEATSWIRQFRDPEGNVPIIATTADSSVDDRTEVLHRGFDEYLYKPLRRMAVANTIRRFLPNRERSSHEARAQGMA
jgi:two-component system sensor histidine kinase/response regulator